jgi:hypothetical protein
VHHPYITAYLSAQRHRSLLAETDRIRRARSVAPREGRARRLLARWRTAWGQVGVPAPGPRVRDYPRRRPT